MSIDTTLIILQLSFLIAGIVLVFLISRAVSMGRKFVSRVYKSRVSWFAGVMLVVLLWILFTGLYAEGIAVEGIAVELAFAAILVAFVYADRMILVTLEMDFFHRNTLHWRQVRKLAYVALFAGLIYLIVQIPLTAPPTCSSCAAPLHPGLPSWVSAIINPTTELIFILEFLAAFIVTFGYSSSTIIIGARRTSDMTMKRHLRWFGLSLLSFVIAIAGGLLTNSFLLASFAVLVLVYTFYRALMSLTFIGRLEVETK
jgi:hypothetical protein